MKINKKHVKASKATKAAAKGAKTPQGAKGTTGRGKATPKRTDAPKGKEAAKAAKPTATPPAKVETSETDFTPVKLPITLKTPGGIEFTISAKSITISQGLREVVFNPKQAQILSRDITEIEGHKLPEAIPAGTAVLARGDVVRLVPHEYTNIINAIKTAKAAAKVANKKGGAK